MDEDRDPNLWQLDEENVSAGGGWVYLRIFRAAPNGADETDTVATTADDLRTILGRLIPTEAVDDDSAKWLGRLADTVEKMKPVGDDWSKLLEELVLMDANDRLRLLAAAIRMLSPQ